MSAKGDNAWLTGSYPFGLRRRHGEKTLCLWDLKTVFVELDGVHGSSDKQSPGDCCGDHGSSEFTGSVGQKSPDS
ncbi:hypothetical protein BaRGS_00014972 [Batillaria attramentaria]|uniref:Uncharacterized protein n=1 Tax=Batillaria attramentaria TaxID=370345 RepID=A0ABD0L3I2_9CAEN